MNYLKFIWKYRIIPNLSWRLIKIIGRYGFTGRRLKNNIRNFIEDSNRFEIYPTLPTTCQVINKYMDFFKQFSTEQLEIALHGFYHQDYTLIPYANRIEMLNKSFIIFEDANIPVSGIRLPYLRSDASTLEMIKNLSIEYDNSHCFWWKVNGWETKKNKKVIRKMKEQYNPFFPEDEFVLPYFSNSLINIPASLPDDDLIWDRSCIKNKGKVTKVWNHILSETMERGELFVMILHPERYHILRTPFLRIAERLKEEKNKIWTAPLRDIARWWKKRSQAFVECKLTGNGKIKVHIRRPRELNYRFFNFNFHKNIKMTGILQSDLVHEEFEVAIQHLPVIGLGEQTTPAFREMLVNLGFGVDAEPGSPEHYSVFFEQDPPMDSKREWLQNFLSTLKLPLIRFNFWPENYNSAFAITGDIDAISFLDFFSRI